MTESFEFWVIIRLFNVEKRLISECLCSLFGNTGLCIFPKLKFLTALIFLIAINSLTH